MHEKQSYDLGRRRGGGEAISENNIYWSCKISLE